MCCFSMNGQIFTVNDLEFRAACGNGGADCRIMSGNEVIAQPEDGTQCHLNPPLSDFRRNKTCQQVERVQIVCQSFSCVRKIFSEHCGGEFMYKSPQPRQWRMDV